MQHQLPTVTALVAALGVALLFCRRASAPASPTPPGQSLYKQEGTSKDGYPEIDASGQGPAGDKTDNWTNWICQYGSGTWSAVYAGEDGWIGVESTGEMRIRIEADIEPSTRSHSSASSDKKLSPGRLRGSLASTTGQYIGISLREESPLRRQPGGSIGNAAFIPRIGPALSTDGGPWRWPDLYAVSGLAPAAEAAWWLVQEGPPARSSYNGHRSL